MKNISVFLSALVALLFSVAETSAQITPPYYNPANVRITGGTINGAVIGGTTAAEGTFALNLTLTGTSQGLVSFINSGTNSITGISVSETGGGIPTLRFNRNSTTGTPTVFTVPGTPTALFTIGPTDVAIASTTDSSSATTGSLKTAGGLGVAKKAYFGDSVNITQNDTSQTITTGISTIILSNTNGANNTFVRIVGGDNTGGTAATILGMQITDVTNNYGNFQFWTRGAKDSGAVRLTITENGDIQFEKTITVNGTTGAQTINKTTGRVNFAAAATSLIVTNSLVTANSIVHCTVATNDTTMKSAACVPAAGSFTIYGNAAATAETAVAFTVTN